MIRLKEHLPVALKPLEEVRAEVIATLSENKARTEASQKADQLLAALQSGASDLETLATESGMEYGLHEAVKRNAFVPDAKLVKEVFKLQKPAEGESVQAVVPADLGFAVVELNAVMAGELDTEQPFARQQYERVVANSYASQEATALMLQLRESAQIEVFEDRIQ
jgi:peptidyl-prolyl cis-trans isomerase D